MTLGNSFSPSHFPINHFAPVHSNPLENSDNDLTSMRNTHVHQQHGWKMKLLTCKRLKDFSDTLSLL